MWEREEGTDRGLLLIRFFLTWVGCSVSKAYGVFRDEGMGFGESAIFEMIIPKIILIL